VNKPDVDPNCCNNAVLRQAVRRMGQLYDDAIAPCGLRATQSGLLAQIQHMDGPTLRELASTIVMDLSALGHTLKPLVRDGLVDLVQDERDRRVKRVHLTGVGAAKLAEAMALWRTAQEGFEAAFGPEKAAELRTALCYIASEEFSQLFQQKRPAAADEQAP
jgi:DNA-binding MarR family transcriptional regulator